MELFRSTTMSLEVISFMTFLYTNIFLGCILYNLFTILNQRGGDTGYRFMIYLYCFAVDRALDWLQSLKQFFINVSYHILSVKEPSELDWLQRYDMTH